jgi:hypothetical protein
MASFMPDFTSSNSSTPNFAPSELDQCPACGYDLRDVPPQSYACPECGRVTPWYLPRWEQQRLADRLFGPGRWAMLGWLGVILVLLAVISVLTLRDTLLVSLIAAAVWFALCASVCYLRCAQRTPRTTDGYTPLWVLFLSLAAGAVSTVLAAVLTLLVARAVS